MKTSSSSTLKRRLSILRLVVVLLLGAFYAQSRASAQAFDRLIVPGDRIGPVAMGKAVNEIVRQLGKPDKEWRSKFRGPGYDADEVHYTYNRYGIWFTWEDKGLQPVVETGWRGICVDSNRWVTTEGIRVGNSIQDVIRAYGEPDEVGGATTDKPECKIHYYSGIVFVAKNRNSPISVIYVVPAGRPGG